MDFTFKIGNKIKEAWPLYKNNLWGMIFFMIIMFVVPQASRLFNSWIFSLFLNILILLLSYIWIRFIFDLIDKKEVNPFSKEILPTLLQFWNLIKTSILYALCVMAGFILLIIPGFYVSGRLVFAIYMSIEKNQGARVTIKEAWKMTEGYGWILFWKSFIINLFMVVGFIAFFIGSFITYPIGIIVIIMMYREFVKFKLQNKTDSSTIEIIKEIPEENIVKEIV